MDKAKLLMSKTDVFFVMPVRKCHSYFFENSGFVQLVQAKSRVSPIKKMSLPRLEFLAARLHASILDSIRRKTCGDHFFGIEYKNFKTH